MKLPRTIVATIPGMIQEADLTDLRRISEVVYHEGKSITQAELAERCADAAYLMLNYDIVKKLDSTFYAHPNVRALKGISVDITGMEWANPELARQNGVTLFNTPRYSTESVAESILCETLLHSRKIHAAYRDLIKGQEPEARKGINLKDRTAGVVGLGSIGVRVADILGALGMSVLAWNRSPRDMKSVTMVSLEELFERAEIICICLKTVTAGPAPTTQIIGDSLLGRCRPGAIVVNLASRHLVDHDALYRYLADGSISGYSVTRGEQTLKLKLAELDSVSMPPPNAWASEESLQMLRKIWAGNIAAAITGTPQNIFSE